MCVCVCVIRVAFGGTTCREGVYHLASVCLNALRKVLYARCKYMSFFDVLMLQFWRCMFYYENKGRFHFEFELFWWQTCTPFAGFMISTLPKLHKKPNMHDVDTKVRKSAQPAISKLKNVNYFDIKVGKNLPILKEINAKHALHFPKESKK